MVLKITGVLDWRLRGSFDTLKGYSSIQKSHPLKPLQQQDHRIVREALPQLIYHSRMARQERRIVLQGFRMINLSKRLPEAYSQNMQNRDWPCGITEIYIRKFNMATLYNIRVISFLAPDVDIWLMFKKTTKVNSCCFCFYEVRCISKNISGPLGAE